MLLLELKEDLLEWIIVCYRLNANVLEFHAYIIQSFRVIPASSGMFVRCPSPGLLPRLKQQETSV
jgi:hypothetical protein